MSQDELSRIYRAGTARGTRDRQNCLMEETMHLAAAGLLPKKERQRFLDHLTACSDCALEYQVALSLKPWAEKAALGETDLRLPAARRRGLGGFLTSFREWTGSFSLSGGVPILAAAAMVLLTVGLAVSYLELRRTNQSMLSYWQGALDVKEQELAAEREQSALKARQSEMEIASLRLETERLLQPQLNVPIFDLEPRSDLRSSTPAAPKIFEIPPGSEYFTLVLNLSADAAYKEYALGISGTDGREVWSGQGLRKSPYNTFTLSLPRQLLPEGLYLIRILGVQGSRRTPLQEFSFEIRYQR